MTRLITSLTLILLTSSLSPAQKSKRSAANKSTSPKAVMVLNRQTAAQLLKQSIPTRLDQYRRYYIVRLDLRPYTGGPENVRRMEAEVYKNDGFRIAEALGWVRLDQSSSRLTTVALTPEGKTFFNSGPPSFGCTEEVYMQPPYPNFRCRFGIAEPIVLSVTGIKQQSLSRAIVEYLWVYRPFKRFEKLVDPTGQSKGLAVFEKYDDGWRITGVDLHPQ